VHAWARWREGKDTELPLGEWRLLDLEGSLRRAQRRWEESIRLLKRAQAEAPREARGSILLNLSFCYLMMGEIGPALRILRRAKTLVLGAGNSRLEWVWYLNFASALQQAGELERAEALLPEVFRRAHILGNELDLLRVIWLQARLDSDRGRKTEAAGGLAQVRSGFASREVAYDTALAGLEEGVLRLGWADQVAQDLACELVWIFRTQGVEPGALAALRLYCQAADRRCLTLEVARQALAALRRAAREPAGATAA
jgi:tetratricopeptide (TPR) repeat protein